MLIFCLAMLLLDLGDDQTEGYQLYSNCMPVSSSQTTMEMNFLLFLKKDNDGGPKQPLTNQPIQICTLVGGVGSGFLQPVVTVSIPNFLSIMKHGPT